MQPPKNSQQGEYAASTDEFSVIQDDHPEGAWPQRFRSSGMPLNLSQEEMAGLRELNSMGSGQPSEEQLNNIIRKSGKPLVVVDLRQEPHAYIGGIPVTWFRPYVSDEELGAETMMSLQNRFVSKMKNTPKIKVDDVEWTQGQEYRVINSIQLDNPEVMTEEDLSRSLGIGYKRFYISVTPTPEQVEEFKQFVSEVGGVTLYFHCWDGSGRTTEFMAMHDILRNGKNVSLATILKRQAAMKGVDIGYLPPTSDLQYPRALKRKAFVEAYYAAVTGKVTK